MRNLIIILSLFIIGCKFNAGNSSVIQQQSAISIPNKKIVQQDSLLRFVNGIYYYNNQLFSGTIENYFPTHQLLSSQTFYNGKEEGWLKTFYPDGKKETERYFHNRDKDSVHKGWWQNGNLKFEHHYLSGNYNGLYRDWYESGKLLKEIVYVNGVDSIGNGWRENGKSFMSYIRKNGRRYGSLNAQPCYSLKNEKGEFIKSAD